MPAKGIKIACPCERCGVVRYLTPGAIKHGQGRYCSTVCKNMPRSLIPHPNDPTITIVPLTRGKVAQIDTVDAERVGVRNWSAGWSGNAWYASAGNYPESSRIFLHRFLMNAPEGVEVDHENGDTLDCRRSANLRLATHWQNQCNTRVRSHCRSGYKGVRQLKGGRWFARIIEHGKERSLGGYDDPVAAARAYDAAARLAFGAFARLNFPDDDAA